MSKGKIAAAVSLLSLLIGLGLANTASVETGATPKSPIAKPALNVNVIQPQYREIPLVLIANGSIAAWQEAIVGAEVSDLQLAEVRVQVGENVHKGQVLAIFADETVAAEVGKSRAALAEAEANLAEARVNAERAQSIAGSGALSNQQVNQYLTGEKTAQAKMQSAKAQLDVQLIQLKHTRVLASDDGIISSRSATQGAVVSKGQELFRMIRQNRLEWRAEVTAAEMAKLKPGVEATVAVAGVGGVKGKVRFLAPTLDTQNRNGLVYVDLPGAVAQGLRAGMFAKGEFRLGATPGLIAPQTAVSLREGFSYVFRLGEQNGDQASVSQVKVELGRQAGDDLEILSGLQPEDRIVASGATFLADGDSVRLVQP